MQSGSAPKGTASLADCTELGHFGRYADVRLSRTSIAVSRTSIAVSRTSIAVSRTIVR
jgi:hypothetical protein